MSTGSGLLEIDPLELKFPCKFENYNSDLELLFALLRRFDLIRFFFFGFKTDSRIEEADLVFSSAIQQN